MKKSFLFALIGYLFLAVSCQRTIEGEQQNFDINMQRLSEISAKYPAFKSACESLRSDATKQMEAAKGFSEEKAKIEGMATANSIAGPTWVRNLAEMDRKINEIRDMATQATQKAGDRTDSDAAWVASRSGEDAIREARSRLSSASTNNPSDAAVVVSTVMSNLEAAEKRLNDVIKTAEEKKSEEKKAEEESKTAEEHKKAEEEQKKAPIKCGHCGNSNPAGSTKCGGCAAPLS